MNKEQLTAKAEAAGMEVDGRWSKETLIEEMKAKGLIEDEKKPVLAPVLLHRAYWPEEGKRVDAGEVVELPTADAKALIAAGKAERADPMPGDE